MPDAMNILVVDDDRRMASTLVDILSLAGYRAEAAHSAHEALTKAQATPYGCVISDIRMPGQSGVELVAALHQLRPGMPIVLMTAYASEGQVARGLRSGAAVVWEKPLQIDRLLEFLAAVGGGRRRLTG